MPTEGKLGLLIPTPKDSRTRHIRLHPTTQDVDIPILRIAITADERSTMAAQWTASCVLGPVRQRRGQRSLLLFERSIPRPLGREVHSHFGAIPGISCRCNDRNPACVFFR